MTPKLRWVAPPNWPPVPEGFEPPEGWQPDPSWPPPPEGWQFWQRADLDVNTGLPWHRRLVQGRPKWWVGAGVVVLVVVAIAVGSTHHTAGRLDQAKLDRGVEHWMQTDLGSVGAVAHCPGGEPAKAGTQFLCAVSDSTGAAHVEVTVINSKGDVTWRLLG